MMRLFQTTLILLAIGLSSCTHRHTSCCSRCCEKERTDVRLEWSWGSRQDAPAEITLVVYSIREDPYEFTVYPKTDTAEMVCRLCETAIKNKRIFDAKCEGNITTIFQRNGGSNPNGLKIKQKGDGEPDLPMNVKKKLDCGLEATRKQ